MTREALKKLNEKQMNYCKTLSTLIDRAKIKGLKEENERNRGKLRGFLEHGANGIIKRLRSESIIFMVHIWK